MKNLIKLSLTARPEDLEKFITDLEKIKKYKIIYRSEAMEQHGTNKYKRYYLQLEKIDN